MLLHSVMELGPRRLLPSQDNWGRLVPELSVTWLCPVCVCGRHVLWDCAWRLCPVGLCEAGRSSKTVRGGCVYSCRLRYPASNY